VIAISLVVLYNNYRYFKQWLYELGTMFWKMCETLLGHVNEYPLHISANLPVAYHQMLARCSH
jgi:hypothetical protein